MMYSNLCLSFCETVPVSKHTLVLKGTGENENSYEIQITLRLFEKIQFLWVPLMGFRGTFNLLQ